MQQKCRMNCVKVGRHVLVIGMLPNYHASWHSINIVDEHLLFHFIGANQTKLCILITNVQNPPSSPWNMTTMCLLEEIWRRKRGGGMTDPTTKGQATKALLGQLLLAQGDKRTSPFSH